MNGPKICFGSKMWNIEQVRVTLPLSYTTLTSVVDCRSDWCSYQYQVLPQLHPSVYLNGIVEIEFSKGDEGEGGNLENKALLASHIRLFPLSTFPYQFLLLQKSLRCAFWGGYIILAHTVPSYFYLLSPRTLWLSLADLGKWIHLSNLTISCHFSGTSRQLCTFQACFLLVI